MLIVPAIKFGNPMMLIVFVEANDETIHESLRVRPRDQDATLRARKFVNKREGAGGRLAFRTSREKRKTVRVCDVKFPYRCHSAQVASRNRHQLSR